VLYKKEGNNGRNIVHRLSVPMHNIGAVMADALLKGTDLSSGLPRGQFHYAFWEISLFRNEASPGCRSTYHKFWANNIG